MARMASFESALEAANADSKVVEESQKDLDQRLGSLEEGGWEERLRGLVMRVNQFQQNIRQVQGNCHVNIVITKLPCRSLPVSQQSLLDR